MNFYKKFLLLFFVSISFMGIIELLIGAIYIESKLDQVKNITKEDKVLLWKNKSQYQTLFFDKKVSLDKTGARKHKSNRNGSLILTLGASPSFGWGVSDQQTYSALIDQKNQDYYVINHAKIGYSSHQGKLLLKDLLRTHKPKYVIIPFVINDIDKFRFYYNNGIPDHKVITNHPYIIKLRNFLKDLKTYKALSSFIQNFVNNLDPQKIQTSSPKINTRVSLPQYIENLKEMISLTIQNKAKPILLKMPVYFPPQLAIEKSQKSWIEFLNQEALRYNQALEKIAKENNILFIDVKKKFETETDFLFISKNDTIHPNVHGHKIISEMIIKVLNEN